MSADNFVAVVPGEADSLGRVFAWYVAHGMMPSIEDTDREIKWKKKIRETSLPFSSREAALIAAHNEVKKIEESYFCPVVEYGVIELD